MTGRGLIISAPGSGAGKTTVTLGLLRALRAQRRLKPAKSGPDYIDPAFHEAAAGVPSVNLDAWAMSPDQIKSLAATEDLLVIEGAMGLFDGAPPSGAGATADIARMLRLPVVLVVDARAMSHSVAALVRGFRDHDPEVAVCGVILNRVGSPRHEAMLRRALETIGMPVFGAIPRHDQIALPSRHLGLVQASEYQDLDITLERMAHLVRRHIDLTELQGHAAPLSTPLKAPRAQPRTMAVARDAAFSFIYAHDLARWRQAGEVRFFSPLADEAVPEADEVFLPGGYPELYGATLARAANFKRSLRKASEYIDIYGECGGYMALGVALVDADGTSHEMVGLLPLITSMATPKRHLGYRQLTCKLSGNRLRGHEFHYAQTIKAEGTPAFDACDAEGTKLAPMGLIAGRVRGSFAHVIA